jgi:hypothetical protein
VHPTIRFFHQQQRRIERPKDATQGGKGLNLEYIEPVVFCREYSRSLGHLYDMKDMEHKEHMLDVVISRYQVITSVESGSRLEKKMVPSDDQRSGFQNIDPANTDSP